MFLKKLAFALLIALACVMPVAFAHADENPNTVYQVNSMSALQGGYWAERTALYLSMYATPGDGGAGYFYKKDCASLPLNTNDGGVIVKDALNNCWLRQVDRGGPISLKFYGAPDATTSACLANMLSCDSVALVAKAYAASAAYGNGNVTSSGRSVAWMTGTPTIPTGRIFDCEGPPGGARKDVTTAPQWLQGSSIVTLAGTVTITGPSQGQFQNCVVRPSFWVPLNVPTVNNGSHTFNDLAVLRNMFRGVAYQCTGEACNIENSVFEGYDECVRISGSARTLLNHLTLGCNRSLTVRTGRGGMHLNDLMAKNWLMTSLPKGCVNWTDNDPVSHCTLHGNVVSLEYPISSYERDSATGWVALTVNTTLPYPAMQITAGMWVFVQDMGTSHSVVVSADCTNLSDTLTNVDTDDEDSSQISTGDVISGSSCIPANTTVVFYDRDADTILMTNAATSTKADQSLTYKGSFISSPAGNGRWQPASVSGNRIVLKGANYDDPTLLASWSAGVQWITAFDHTDLRVGQNLCSTTTAFRKKYCDPPSSFSYSSTTSSDIASLGASGTGTITVGSTANWPTSATMKICNGSSDQNCSSYEAVQYALVTGSQTQVQVLQRAANGTTGAAHNSSDAIKAEAPRITDIVPIATDINGGGSSGGGARVRLNVVARTKQVSGTPVTFANDNTTFGTILGSVLITNGYFNWCANPECGAAIDAGLRTTVVSSSGPVLTLAANAWKVRPNMVAFDETDPNNIKAVTVIAGPTSDTDQTVTLASTPGSSPNGHTIVFAGCDAPVNDPRSGNCGGVAYQLGNLGSKTNQGTTFVKLHAFGYQTALNVANSPATGGVDPYFDAGGDGANAADPGNVGLRVGGDARKIQMTGGRLAGHFALYNDPNKQTDPLRLDTMQFGIPGPGCYIVNVGPDSALQIDNSGGSEPGCTFIDQRTDRVAMNNNTFDNSTFDVEDPKVWRVTSCSGNLFATSECTDTVASSLSCTSGCTNTTDVSGSDANMVITTNGSATSVTVQMGRIHRDLSLLSCHVNVNANANAWISSITAGNNVLNILPTITFNTSVAVTKIYGGCV